MFSSNPNRFLSMSCRLLTKFRVFPEETPVRHRALVETIAESKDQTAFFAWHPKKEIPYEFTRALPTALEQKSYSMLKDQKLEDAKQAFSMTSKQHFVIERLTKVTFTSKHRWFPRCRDKRAKRTVMDRPYL